MKKTILILLLTLFGLIVVDSTNVYAKQPTHNDWVNSGWSYCGEFVGYRSVGGHKGKYKIYYQNKTYMVIDESGIRGELEDLDVDEQYFFKNTDLPIKYTKFIKFAPLKDGRLLYDNVLFQQKDLNNGSIYIK